VHAFALLAKTFRALVERLGGTYEASVFDRVYAAWSGPSRHYHNARHLVECLMEVDAVGAGDIAELALWYHDVIYVVGQHDCEEQSAVMLLADAKTMGIPEVTANEAAELVRATAHAHGRAARAADLVVDIDLSILGRDPKRFMEYELDVEKEYAAIPTPAFRKGRGDFLEKLLERPRLFATEHFHQKYEAQARANVKALLASPRYTDFR